MNAPAAHPVPGMIPPFPPEWAEVFGEDDAGIFAEFTLKEVRFVWRWIPPGRFRMGCGPEDTAGYDKEKPAHEVVITRGFWLGETPVTQAQWLALRPENPSYFEGDDRPVEEVTWPACATFAVDLNVAIPGLAAALPTEAQWEYACRAGTTGAFHDGSPCTRPEGEDPALDRLGWFDGNSGGETHPVKEKLPNAWGLYDLHGNVWEWCRDVGDDKAYAARANGATDPETVAVDGADRVVRGGSWINHARICRAAFRFGRVPGFRFRILGFRLAAGLDLRAAEPQSGDAERPVGPERRSRG